MKINQKIGKFIRQVAHDGAFLQSFRYNHPPSADEYKAADRAYLRCGRLYAVAELFYSSTDEAMEDC
ncbi:MAG: hypothetical protein IGS39_22970 [Calothrix sp. C42_A2020_038]|nr:hypothetical protein [Calothrix sp. C42_A2020_038]